jgi:hypothetical protein
MISRGEGKSFISFVDWELRVLGIQVDEIAYSTDFTAPSVMIRGSALRRHTKCFDIILKSQLPKNKVAS